MSEVTDYWKPELEKTRKQRDKLKAENARMRECVEWYADQITYARTQLKHPQTAIADDEGKKARACLAAIRKNRDAK